MSSFDFSKTLAKAAEANRNKTFAAASAGGLSFGVVNSRNNGKRLSFSKALVTALDLEDTVELLPAQDDGVLFVAKKLPSAVKFSGKLSSEGKKLCYACPGHKGRDASCPTKEIPAEYVNKLVLGYVVPTYLREELVPAINKALTSDFDDDALTWRKRGIERKINNVARSLEAHFSETMAERLEQLEKEKAEVLEQMERRETTTITIGKENLKEARKKLYRYLMTSSDVEAREFLKSVIKEVKITNDTVSFALNVD